MWKLKPTATAFYSYINDLLLLSFTPLKMVKTKSNPRVTRRIAGMTKANSKKDPKRASERHCNTKERLFFYFCTVYLSKSENPKCVSTVFYPTPPSPFLNPRYYIVKFACRSALALGGCSCQYTVPWRPPSATVGPSGVPWG